LLGNKLIAKSFEQLLFRRIGRFFVQFADAFMHCSNKKYLLTGVGRVRLITKQCFFAIIRRNIMKFGTLTFQPHKPAGFDFHVYRVKPETGLRLHPQRTWLVTSPYSLTHKLDKTTRLDFTVTTWTAKFGNNNFNFYWSVLCQPSLIIGKTNFTT